MYVRKNKFPKSIEKEFSALVTASRLKVLRLHFDVTQEKLARTLGVGRTTYRYYENAFANIPAMHIATLAQVYGVTTDYLLGLTDQSFIPRLNKRKVEINEEALIERKLTHAIEAWKIPRGGE